MAKKSFNISVLYDRAIDLLIYGYTEQDTWFFKHTFNLLIDSVMSLLKEIDDISLNINNTTTSYTEAFGGEEASITSPITIESEWEATGLETTSLTMGFNFTGYTAAQMLTASNQFTLGWTATASAIVQIFYTLGYWDGGGVTTLGDMDALTLAEVDYYTP